MKFQRKNKAKLSLDMTPLIDVIFLLLIFFMISTTFIETDQIPVVLPEVATASEQKIKSPLELTLNDKNQIFIGKQRVYWKSLKKTIAKKVKRHAYKSAVLRADGEVKHKMVVRLMDNLKQSGIQKISVATLLTPSR